MTARYTDLERDALARAVLEDGHVILPAHLPTALLQTWRAAFAPLLARHLATEGDRRNRGVGRYYVTLPFVAPFADPRCFEDDDVLAIVERLVGADAVMSQLATDTPLAGSTYQDVHRDAPPLFPEAGVETPPFQLAVNFPLVDVTVDNGPFEVARGTHVLAREVGLARIARGETPLAPVLMQLGDVLIRDVRGLHRGTPNRTEVARPMVVIGYGRRWLHRPEVSIRVPRATHAMLSERARHLLRFNPIVEHADDGGPEIYQAYAY